MVRSEPLLVDLKGLDLSTRVLIRKSIEDRADKMKNRAFYGDIHGCADELEELMSKVEAKYSGIEHWHVGDLVDRGPYSGKVVRRVRDRFAGGVDGNHDNTIKKAYWAQKRRLERGEEFRPHPNPDKANTLSQLDDELVRYLDGLPHLHVFDDVGLIIVHGGVLPGVSLAQQPPEVCVRAQMIKPNDFKAPSRWWGNDAGNQPRVKKTEAESRAEGYVRWYEAYDQEYDCIYGHSVIGDKPYIHQREGYGRTIGIDTGSCFGGSLTAFIYPAMDYLQVQCQNYGASLGKSFKDFKGMT